MAKSSGFKLIANNKKAYFDFFIDDKFECGIALAGTEVKSMRMGKCSIKESFVRITNDEVMIYGMHISPYEKGNIFNKDPLRERKLLMHRYEINKLKGKIQEKGYTLYAQSPTNQVFVVLSHEKIAELEKNFAFEAFGHVDDDHEAMRFVCSWATKPEAVDALIESL